MNVKASFSDVKIEEVRVLLIVRSLEAIYIMLRAISFSIICYI